MEVGCRLVKGGRAVELLLNTGKVLGGGRGEGEGEGEDPGGLVWDEEESETGEDEKRGTEEVKEEVT